MCLALCFLVAESTICRQVTSLCSAPVAQEVYMRALQGAQAAAVTGLDAARMPATCVPLLESVEVCRAGGRVFELYREPFAQGSEPLTAI